MLNLGLFYKVLWFGLNRLTNDSEPCMKPWQLNCPRNSLNSKQCCNLAIQEERLLKINFRFVCLFVTVLSLKMKTEARGFTPIPTYVLPLLKALDRSKIFFFESKNLTRGMTTLVLEKLILKCTVLKILNKNTQGQFIFFNCTVYCTSTWQTYYNIK